MKRVRILGAAFVAIVAMSTLTAAASAVTFLLAEWLLNGSAIASADPYQSEGELTLINLNGGGFGVKVEILCSSIGVGTVGPGSADETTGILTLSLESVTSTKTESCANTANCEGALSSPVGLPWKSELELMEDGTETFFADLGFNAAYLSSCTILGVKVEEECKVTEAAGQATNESNGTVDLSASATFELLAGLSLGECGGRPDTAEVSGLGILTPTGGGALTVSE